jgi:hypothetical protein
LLGDETLFDIVGVTNTPSATHDRSRQSSVVDTTTVTLTTAPNIMSDPDQGDSHPTKQLRLSAGHTLSLGLKPISPQPTPPLSLSDQASSLSEGIEKDQGVCRDTDRREMDRQGSSTKVRKRRVDELSIPPTEHRRRKRRYSLADTGLRPLDRNTVAERAKQQARSSQPQRKSRLGRPRTDKGPQTCSPRSYSPDKTAGVRRNINYGPSHDTSYQISGLARYPIPKGSSIVTATVRCCDSNWSLDPVALGHKVLGKQVTVIRIIQLHDSWELLGYQCNDGAPGLYDNESLNAEWMNSSHSDATSYTTDHSDDDYDGKGDFVEQDIGRTSQRTHVAWLESDEELLLSYKDKQGMGWEEIYEFFPERSEGAVKARYYMLHKK